METYISNIVYEEQRKNVPVLYIFVVYIFNNCSSHRSPWILDDLIELEHSKLNSMWIYMQLDDFVDSHGFVVMTEKW